MPKGKLRPGFDPIWNSEFLDFKLQKMSRTAFIIRQMYRSYRNPANNTCNLSDLQIRNITGWHLRTIQNARKQLIRLGEIIPTGYHSFAVKAFHQFSESLAQNAKLPEKNFSIKGETSLAENANDFSRKGETSLAEKAKLQSHPYKTDTDIQIDFLTPESIKTLKMLFGNDELRVKNHLLMRGYTESDIVNALSGQPEVTLGKT